MIKLFKEVRDMYRNEVTFSRNLHLVYRVRLTSTCAIKIPRSSTIDAAR